MIKHTTATQRERQTVHSEVMRQFLFIQLKYGTVCWRKTRNFNSSPRVILVQGTSFARQITANSWV